jgi:hypothetical protein
MKKCKYCKSDIDSKAKVCPNCTRKQRGSLGIIIFIVIIVIIIIASQGNGNNSINDNSNNTNSKNQESSVPNGLKTYRVGKYLVGKDIEPGLYKVILKDSLMKMGYIERASDTDMSFSSIIANIILTGNGYVDIKSTDVAVKLTGVEMYKIDLATLEKNAKDEINDGIYLVGYDIKPGTYKVEVTDTNTNMAYVERAKNVSMGLDDIIANELIQGQGYVTIKDSDFAVRVQGAKLILQ